MGTIFKVFIEIDQPNQKKKKECKNLIPKCQAKC